MEKKNLILIMILVLISLTAGLIINIQSNRIDFETISKGYYSVHKESANYIINSKEELESRGINISEINFSQFSVIAVFMGEFNTGGYEIEITKIIEKENEIIVRVNKTYPGPGSIVTQAFSQPYHIIKIKKIEKQVIFENES